MTETHRLRAPLKTVDLKPLRIGDKILISGVVYTARDAAHQRLVECLEKEDDMPFSLDGQIIYYVGPTPAPPGRVIGAAGPTSSYRMDPYAPTLIRKGLKAMIGKGSRSQEVREAMLQFGAVYLAAIGGAGAIASGAIREAEIIAYPELGPEAIRRLVFEDFPAVVVNDLQGGDLYEEGRRQYERSCP
jgi:fumarate hydratase subunit beta